MRNQNLDWGEGGDYDYSPNELAELSTSNPKLYKEVVQSNLDEGDSIESWQQRNLDSAQEFLDQQSK